VIDALVAHGPAILFYLFATLAVVGAVGVVTLRNPMYGALSLLGTFLSIAALFLLRHAEFVAIVQVFVYGGGIMVLFLFVIMLLNLQHQKEEPTRPVQQFLGYVTSAGFGIGIIYYIVKYATFAMLPDGRFQSDTRAIGKILFEKYVFPFEMVSILLLAAIVGALLMSGRAAGQRAKVGAELEPTR
jgi:NADH-quinone oxidoreductase subunit J